MHSPRSPGATKSSSCSSSTTSTSASCTVGNTCSSYSRQQLGALYSSSPDPMGRMKMGSTASTSSKVS